MPTTGRDPDDRGAASEEILFDLFTDLLSTMGMNSTSSSSRITIDVGREMRRKIFYASTSIAPCCKAT